MRERGSAWRIAKKLLSYMEEKSGLNLNPGKEASFISQFLKPQPDEEEADEARQGARQNVRQGDGFGRRRDRPTEPRGACPHSGCRADDGATAAAAARVPRPTPEQRKMSARR